MSFRFVIAGGLVSLEALRVTLDALRTEMAQDATILQNKEALKDIITDAAQQAKVSSSYTTASSLIASVSRNAYSTFYFCVVFCELKVVRFVSHFISICMYFVFRQIIDREVCV